MVKAGEYILALAVIGLVVFLVMHGGRKGHAIDVVAPPAPITDTYASLQKFAVELRAQQEAGIKASNGMAPPVTYTPLTNRTFTGTGKILRAENTMGRGVLYLDLNGDGQWELKVDLSGLPLPEGLTEGVSVDFQATVASATMDGDRLVLEGQSAPALIKVAGAK